MKTLKALAAISLRFQPGLLIVLMTLVLCLPQRSEGKDSLMLRIVCATVLEGKGDHVLASRNKKGSLDELHAMKLYSSFVSPWLPVPPGELELCVSDGEEMVSTCRFTCPKGATRVLLVLLPGKEAGQYTTEVIDAAKRSFGKGNTLILNSSEFPTVVKLGEKEVEAKPGESQVVSPEADENGMYQMLVSYANEEEEEVICKDSFLPVNETARDYLVIVPDPNSGIRVVTLSEFGPFE